MPRPFNPKPTWPQIPEAEKAVILQKILSPDRYARRKNRIKQLETERKKYIASMPVQEKKQRRINNKDGCHVY